MTLPIETISKAWQWYRFWITDQRLLGNIFKIEFQYLNFYNHIQILSQVTAIWRKWKIFKNWSHIQFRKAVFVPLRFLLFSWLILIRKMTSGGVLESSGSPLVDGHRDFQNRCRNGWENWSWSWHFEHLNNFGMKLEIQTI